MPEKSTNPETKQVSARTKKPVQLTLEARSDVINFEKRDITKQLTKQGYTPEDVRQLEAGNTLEE